MSAPRVLFIHGLEGHPEGTKVRMLRAQGFEVHAADMHMSVWRLTRKNSVVRNILRQVEVRRVLLAAAAGLGAAAALGSAWIALGAVVALGAWAKLRMDAMGRAGIAASFDRCVEIQARAVSEVEPEVVVGSSWGGAVAGELLLAGTWSGPTILLAPAVRVVSSRSARTDPSPALAQLDRPGRPVIIFHDPSDEVIPHAHSVALGEGEAMELRSVDAGGHRLLGLLERGELGETIRALSPS